MARKKRHQRHGQGNSSSALSTLNPPLSTSSQFASNYDGANVSVRRGQIFWSTLETRQELDTFTRSELMRRIRWLCANVGMVRALVRNSAMLVGCLTPQATTGDRPWNREAERRFRQWGGRASTFSRCGKYTFESAQLMLTRNSKRDGDVFTVLTTTPDGKRPMLAFYEAHQLANPDNAPKCWVDGVKIDGAGRHLMYGFRSIGEDGKQKVTVVPAASVIYYGEFDSPGHVRAVPPLAHAINHAIDITEIRADTKHAIKTGSLFGVVREITAGSPPTKAQRGMGGALSELRRGGPAAAGSGSSGSPEAVRLESRQVYGGGQIPELNPGEKLSTVHDERPSPNMMAFEDVLVRDISIGFGLPPEVIVKIVSLTGPGVRFAMEWSARWAEKEQARLWDWAERVWWYFLAFETRDGLGFPSEGDFMAVDFIPQRDMTIDRGREGRQRMEEIDRGLGTMGDWYKSVSGASAEAKTLERIAEVKFAMDECERSGVPYELVFPPKAGAAIANTEKPGDPEEEEEPAKP